MDNHFDIESFEVCKLAYDSGCRGYIRDFYGFKLSLMQQAAIMNMDLCEGEHLRRNYETLSYQTDFVMVAPDQDPPPGQKWTRHKTSRKQRSADE